MPPLRPLVRRRASGARRWTWKRHSPLCRTALVAYPSVVEAMLVHTQRTSFVRMAIELVAEMMMFVWLVPRIDTEKIVSSARWMIAIAFVWTSVFDVQSRLVTLIIPRIVIGMVPPRNVSAVLLFVSLVASQDTNRIALTGFCGKSTSAVLVEVVTLRVT